MRRQFTVVGPLAGASASNISLAATGPTSGGALTLNGTTVTAGVATLDKPRRVIITSSANDGAVGFTIVGTGWFGQAFTESVTGASGTAASSVLDYKTVSSVTSNASTAGTVTVGTNGVAGSSWVSFDDWINAPAVAFQCTAAGTVNYTVQQTLDDPNQSTSTGVTAMQPQNMTWLNCSDSAAVAATGSIQSNYQFAPVWARVVVNSGATGSSSVTATFRQVGK